MAEGYCVKCKAKKEIADGVEEVMKKRSQSHQREMPDLWRRDVQDPRRQGHAAVRPRRVVHSAGC